MTHPTPWCQQKKLRIPLNNLENLRHILSSFEPVSLAEMDGVKLMDRTDTKFTLAASALPLVLHQLSEHYKVLHINANPISTYKTLYFDTFDLELYLKHHSGHLNRYKIRYRNYVDSNLGFLEVKFKNNKGRTQKERIKQKETPLAWNAVSFDFLSRRTPYDPRLLEPSVWVNYQRITLVGKEVNERVTIDIHLEFIAGTLARKIDELVIVEVKQSLRGKSPAIAILKSHKIREESLSKYCLGITQMYPHVKKNNFKQKLNTLNKLIHDTSFNTAAGIAGI